MSNRGEGGVISLRGRRRGRPQTTARELAHLSDEAVIALIARADEQALAELYRRFGRLAYGLAFRILRDDALAQDAVQEAFLGVWRAAGRFTAERAKPSTWLLTLVHRRAVDLVRRAARRPAPSSARADELSHRRFLGQTLRASVPPLRQRLVGQTPPLRRDCPRTGTVPKTAAGTDPSRGLSLPTARAPELYFFLAV